MPDCLNAMRGLKPAPKWKQHQGGKKAEHQRDDCSDDDCNRTHEKLAKGLHVCWECGLTPELSRAEGVGLND